MSPNLDLPTNPYLVTVVVGVGMVGVALIGTTDWAMLTTGVGLTLIGTKSIRRGFDWRPLVVLVFAGLSYLIVASYTRESVPSGIWAAAWIVSLIGFGGKFLYDSTS